MQAPPPPPPPHPTYHPPIIEDGGHGFVRPKSPILTFCLGLSHNLTQIFIGGVVATALMFPNINFLSDSFTQHVILCTVGYFVLMTQAVLSFSPFGYASHLKYENKRIIHAVLQVVGGILAIAGSVIRIIDVNTNFDSAHGICGIIAMILAICSLIGGAVTLIFPEMTFMKILHSVLGSVTLCFAFISIIFAYDNYYRLGAGDRNANLAIVFSVFGLVGTLLMGSVRTVRRLLNK